MPSAKQIKLDDEALKKFAEGRFNSRIESKIAVAIEQSPELQERLAAVSSDGMLDRVRAIASQSRAGDEVSPTSMPAQASSTPHPSTGKRLIKGVPKELAASEDYQILKELGRGGMGVVYLAKYLPMDRPEVLKVLNAQMVRRESARQRFVTEMRAIGKLNHPSIATAYQQVPLQTQLVFSMEYVPGMDLHKFIAKYRPIPIAAACTIASQIAGALQHAHKRKMVHRDIKPSNVMVFKEDGQRQIKILDFGLAKATSEHEAVGLTADGTMLGTPEYMAPEQALDAATADIRADIYSLGCTLYHMLVGRPPFTGTYQSVLMSHATKEADYISLERTDVPVELSEIVAKMMAKEPKKRYQTPNEAAAALKPLCGAAQVTKTAKPSDAKIDTAIDLASPSRDTSIEGPSDLPVEPVPQAVPAAEVASKPSASVEDRLADLKVQPRVRRKRSQTRSGKRRGSARRKRTPRGLLIAGGILAALLVWASVVLLKTDKGTLIIEGIPENAEVLIDGERVDVVVDGKTMTAEAVLAEGEHQVRVTIDGGVVQGQTVSIRSDRETNLLFRQSETSAGGAPTNAMPNMTASQDGWRPMFNANDFSGWLHDPDYWSISNGVVVGKRGQQESQSPTYLVSQTVYQDFEAKFKIKLVGDASDSGFLFRSILTDEKALIVSGPQYNILQGDWGSLMMQGSSKGGLKGGSLQDADQAVVRSLVVPNDFNSVHVTCRGKDVVVALNGTNIIEGKFETIPSAGILAWQLYKGPDFDVHIKDAYVRAAQVPNGSPLTDELEKRKVSDTNGMLNEAGVTVDSRRVTEQQPEETVVVPEFEGADKRFLESLTTLIKAQPELYYWIVPNFAGDDGIRGTRFSYANAPSGYHPEIPDEPFRDKLLKHFDGNISARAREHAAQLAALHNKSLPASNRPPSQNSLGRRRIVVPAKSSGATLGNLRKGQIIIISHVSGEWGYGGQMKKSTVSPDVWHLSQYLTAQLSTPGGQTITLPGETAQCPFVYKVFSDGEHLISMNDGKKEDNVGDVTYDVEVFNSKPDWLGGDFVATTENLIQNPGAESFDEFANIHNWNLLTGRMLASTEIYRRKILNGKASFACGSCWKAILSQQIDLKRHQATFSAGETVVRLRTSVNTYNQPIDDRGSVRIAVYDENHRLLGSRDSGYRTTRNKWRQIENHYRIPVNARFLEIFLVGLRPAYNNNDVAFDDVSVELGRLNDQSGSASPRGLELIKPAVPRIQWSFNEQSERRELFSDPIATERFQSSDVSGQSLRFSDGSDAVTAHAPMRITGSSPRTVSFWVRPNQPFGDDRRVVFRWGDESHTGSKFAFLASSTEVMIHCRDQDFKVPYAIINEQWTHFMIVHDGQAIHVYADGKRIGEKGSTFLDTAETPITLSDGGSVSFYSPWRGEIDEFEVYDQALADVQLRDLGLKHHRFDLVEKTKAATERLDMFARQMSSLSDPGISLFNGRDLTGWQGSIQCWSAVDRELVGISGSKDRIPIVSDQEVAGDFELRFEINGTISNGGVRYRSSKAKSSASQAIEFDIGNGRWGRTGNIWSRPVVSRVGQKVILAPGGVRSTTALPTLEDNKSKTGISQEGWISCRIISTEFGIRHYVNGELVAEVLDPYRRLTQTGSIELATMRGSTIGLRFRNLILRSKRLER